MSHRPHSALAAFLTRLRHDRRGVSAVEFALLAPVLILIYFGLSELSQGFIAQKRTAHAASIIADLVAQTDVVKKSEVGEVFAIAALSMEPFPNASLSQRLTSVTRDQKGDVRVDWSQSQGAALPALTKKAIVANFPVDLLEKGDSAVMGETSYDYTSPVQYVLPKVTLKGQFYLRPRRVNTVGCSDC